MIDPKIDIRDAETLNKFEQAMRVANIKRYSNASGGRYASRKTILGD